MVGILWINVISVVGSCDDVSTDRGGKVSRRSVAFGGIFLPVKIGSPR